MNDNYVRKAFVSRVVDGDTVRATVDLGYHTAAWDVTLRLARVNAPEVGTADGTLATMFTRGWIADHAQHGEPAMVAFPWLVQTHKSDTWQRYIAEVECRAGHNLSDDLLAAGHAVPYP